MQGYAVLASSSGELFSIDSAGTFRSCDITTGKFQQILLSGEAGITSFDCSHDGRTIVAGTRDGQLQLWDVASATRKGPKIERNTRVLSVVLSPDGKTFVARFEDNIAQIWSTQTYMPQGAALRARGPITSVAYSPDSRFVVTGSTDGVARIWDTQPLDIVGRTSKSDKKITAVAMSPNGQKIATGDATGLVQLWNPSSGEPIGHPMQSDKDHANQIAELTFSSDGRALASNWYEEERNSVYFPTVRLWNLETREPIGELLHLRSHFYNNRPCAAFSLDGRLIASADVYQVQLWNTEGGDSQPPPLKQSKPCASVAIGPDCQTLAIGSDDRSMRFWNAATGQPIGNVMSDGSADVVAFSPDGQLVLAGGDDAAARLWHVPSGKPFGKPLVHGGKVLVVGFSADGHTALTAGDDQTCKLWDVATCEPAGEPLRSDGSVSNAVFSSDGKTVMTVSYNGAMRLWDAASCKPLSWPFVVRGPCKFSPDGSLVLVTLDDTVELWRVPREIADDVDLVKSCVESAAALRVTEHGTVERIPYDQWLAAKTRLGTFQQNSNTRATSAP
jgi:WD40 repeat protein